MLAALSITVDSSVKAAHQQYTNVTNENMKLITDEC